MQVFCSYFWNIDKGTKSESPSLNILFQDLKLHQASKVVQDMDWKRKFSLDEHGNYKARLGFFVPASISSKIYWEPNY